MAITLPRASPASQGLGGIRIPSKRPVDAGDVPQQAITRDPGLTIPDLGAPARALEGVGTAISGVGEVFAVVAQRARNREDLSTETGWEGLRQEIRRKINSRLQKGQIRKVMTYDSLIS